AGPCPDTGKARSRLPAASATSNRAAADTPRTRWSSSEAGGWKRAEHACGYATRSARRLSVRWRLRRYSGPPAGALLDVGIVAVALGAVIPPVCFGLRLCCAAFNVRGRVRRAGVV